MQTTDDTSSKKIRSINKLLDLRDVILQTDPDCLTKEFIRDITGYYNHWDKRKAFGEWWLNPESIKNRTECIRKYWSDPKNRERRRQLTIERYKNPEAHLKTSLGNIKRYMRPEERERSRMWGLKVVHKPASREKLVENAIGGFWYGNVRYYNGPQYCELWNDDLKERVRAFFGYQCIECGQPQNGRALHVHHVWYNKKACCDNSPRSLVPLCHECHSITSCNNKTTRQQWSEYFQYIIDNYYGGKCYLTKDEMRAYRGVH